jgi:hypothetical protein
MKKKYRLGNQPEEYELSEDYLGWLPEGDKTWEDLSFESVKNTELTLANPAEKDKKTIFLHHCIIKDAFPLSFFGEERSEKWGIFAIVSETQTSEKFIIPLY